MTSSANDRPTSSRLLTRAERQASGKALRAVVSRESHADFAVDPHRDPLAILTANDKSRVPALVPERYRRMAPDPFAFYRGAAALMAHDLAGMKRIGLPVQVCGDAHLMNFGAFSSPENNVLFDINDFDEPVPVSTSSSISSASSPASPSRRRTPSCPTRRRKPWRR